MENKTPEPQIKAVEAHLSGALQPISMPGDFTRRVRARIRFPERGMLAKRLSDWEFALIITGSVMSVALAIVTLARAFYYFFRKSARAGA